MYAGWRGRRKPNEWGRPSACGGLPGRHLLWSWPFGRDLASHGCGAGTLPAATALLQSHGRSPALEFFTFSLGSICRQVWWGRRFRLPRRAKLAAKRVQGTRAGQGPAPLFMPCHGFTNPARTAYRTILAASWTPSLRISAERCPTAVLKAIPKAAAACLVLLPAASSVRT